MFKLWIFFIFSYLFINFMLFFETWNCNNWKNIFLFDIFIDFKFYYMVTTNLISCFFFEKVFSFFSFESIIYDTRLWTLKQTSRNILKNVLLLFCLHTNSVQWKFTQCYLILCNVCIWIFLCSVYNYNNIYFMYIL